MSPEAEIPSSSRLRRRPLSVLQAGILAGLLSASSVAAGDATVESGATARARRLAAGEPWLDRSVVGKAHNQMLVAFKVALELVKKSPSCNALFSNLGADGTATLLASRYAVATKPCRPGSVAVTAVGQPGTWLCPGFVRLTSEEAAIILLHEALHFAGLTEQPLDPAGPSALEINRRVRKACRT